MIEDGYTFGYINRKYGIDYELLRQLWSRYQKDGAQALTPKVGTGDTFRRVEIMQDYYKNHLTLREVLSKYDISTTCIWRWRHIVETKGWEELRQLGSTEHYRRGKMRKPKKDPPQTEEDRLREELSRERARNAKLEKDLERARAENALLKKVKALVEEREARLRGIGRKPSKD